jgi:hypothetical protein
MVFPSAKEDVVEFDIVGGAWEGMAVEGRRGRGRWRKESKRGGAIWGQSDLTTRDLIGRKVELPALVMRGRSQAAPGFSGVLRTDDSWNARPSVTDDGSQDAQRMDM